jgi:hypothetical protein
VRFDVCLPNEEHLILLRYACGAGWRMYSRLPPRDFFLSEYVSLPRLQPQQSREEAA